jgi:hypothetical protein
VPQSAGPSRSRPTSHRRSHRYAPCGPASSDEPPRVSRHALVAVHSSGWDWPPAVAVVGGDLRDTTRRSGATAGSEGVTNHGN